jgi:hypothetical protein
MIADIVMHRNIDAEKGKCYFGFFFYVHVSGYLHLFVNKSNMNDHAKKNITDLFDIFQNISFLYG